MGEEDVRERFGIRSHALDPPLEVVECGDGGDRHEEPHRRGDQRFRDRAHDGLGSQSRGCRGCRRIGPAQNFERFHDADDGAEESEEGGVVAHRTEEGKPFLETDALQSGGSHHRFLGRHRPEVGMAQPRHDHRGRRRGRGIHPLQGLSNAPSSKELVQVGGELLGIIAQRAQEERTLDDQHDVHDREADQDPHDPRGLEVEQGMLEQIDEGQEFSPQRA